MLKITIGNNVKRVTKMVPETTTLRQALEEEEINYTLGGVQLDGCQLQPGDIGKTFAQMGVTERAYLLQVVKADNAA